jgi:hypothetical protein
MSYWLGQVSEMLRLVERIGPVVQWLGDEAQRARLHQISAIALLRRDRYVSSAEVVGHARAYLAAVQLAGSASAEPAARFQLGFVLLWSASVTDAETELAHALELAERSGDISLVARCLTYLALAARTRSDPAAVRGYAERALRVAQDTLMHDYIGAAHGNLAWLAWRAGDLDGVYSHCGAALDAWRSLPTPYMFEWVARWPQIAHDLARGDVVSAGAHARILVQETQQRPAPALESMLAAAVRAAEAGELETVRVQLEAALVPARLLGHL